MAHSTMEEELINARLMRFNFDWWRWLVIAGFAMLVMSLFCRCTTTKYVPMVQYKEKIVSKTDSFLQTDSVWIHDSIFVSQKGDTIFTDKWHYKDRYKYIYKNNTDTLVVCDSIPYKVEIEKPFSFNHRVELAMGKGYIGLILSLALACVLVWLINRKK